MLHYLESPATQHQIDEMLETWEIVIKVAVDVRRGVLAGGGKMHADCEAELLARGSKQDDIWGATWVPLSREVQYDSLINIRPSKNPAMEILDEQTRAHVGQIVTELLGGYMNELSALRDRFMRDPLPIRIGNLASNLAQIHSLSGHDGHRDGVARFVEESALYIESAAPDATLDVQMLLLEIQRNLVQWKRQWAALWDDTTRRAEAARKARAWSEQVLAASGLLEAQSRQF